MSGHVVRPGPDGEVPVPDVFVTVHRVGPDSAAPLDSARTDAAGRYTVRYQRFGSEDAVYFAAAVYSGIAYFTPPLRGQTTRGGDAEIFVFDTTTAAVRFGVQGRHIVVGAAKPDGTRDVVEVYELSNDTTVTVVGRDSVTGIWSAPLPAGATNWSSGKGDVAAPSMASRDGRVRLLSPFEPGIKQVSYSYSLPARAFPLRFVLEQPASVLEVLAEEFGAQVRSASLRSADTATTEGRTFKRFIAQNAPAGEEVRIDVPASSAGMRARVLIGVAVVLALAMGAALARALRARRPTAPDAQDDPASLAAAIAALDARRDAGDDTLDDARYRTQREALKSRLTAALAGAPPPA